MSKLLTEITLEDLVEKVHNHLKNNKLIDLELNNYHLKNYSKYIVFEKNKYTRNKLFYNQDFEIVLITWDKNSIADYHQHPENGCKLKVLMGKLHETIKHNDNTKKENILLPGKSSYLDDTIGTHKIVALNKTVSLHIYSPSGFYN